MSFIPPAYRPILQRGILFIVGGLISYALNLLPYRWLTKVWAWEHNSAYALTLTWVTVLMFIWNYRVNFPTLNHWRHCAVKYLTCMVAMWAVNFFSVQLLRDVLPDWLAIFIVGFVVAVLKFGVYHWWVFPHRDAVAA